MIENILIATNDELKKEIERLTTEFEDTKMIIVNLYDKMTVLKRKHDEIMQVLNKREGGINGEQ